MNNKLLFKEKVKNKVINRELSLNVLTLMIGRILAQAIPFIISVYLTRIYTPEDFGIYSMYTFSLAILSVIVTARYEFSIMLPENDEEAINLVALSISIVTCISLLIFLLLLLFFNDIKKSLLEIQLSTWLYILPVSVFLNGIYQTFNFWFNRNKRYKSISISVFFQSLTSSLSSLILGIFGFGVVGLVIGGIIGQLIATGLIVIEFWRKDSKKFYLISSKLIIDNFKSYKSFPIFSLPNAMLEVASNNLASLLINFLFSFKYGGYYSFAMKILNIPMGILSVPFSQVFFRKLTESLSNKENCKKLVLRTWLILFFLGAIPYTIILFYGESIFSLVYGSDWKEAGEIASYLSPILLLMFISYTTNCLYVVLKIQHIDLFFGIITFLLRIATFLIGHIFGNIYIALLSLLTLEVIQTVLYNAVAWRKLSRFDKLIHGKE